MALSTKGVRISYTQAGSPWNTEDNDYYYDPLEPEMLRPKIVTESQEFSTHPGEDITLPCVVDREWHSLVWRRGGNILWVLQNHEGNLLLQSVTRDDRFGRNDTSLTIKNIDATDEGTYTCELSETVPPRNVSHVLKVRVPPEVMSTNRRSVMTIKMGRTAILGCKATGNPEPNITWTYEYRLLSNTLSNHKLTKCNHLRISSTDPPVVEAREPEVYIGVGYRITLACFVYAQPRAQVKWYRKGGVPIDPMRLMRTVNSDNRYSLQFSRVNFDDLGGYTCNATNFMGNSSASVRLTARPKPVKFVSPHQGDMETNYTLIWEVESYHPVLAYDIAYRNDTDEEDQWITFTVPGTTSSTKYHSMSHTFTDLEPGSAYYVRVVARNEYGRGDANESFAFTTLDSAGTDSPTYAQPSGEESAEENNPLEDNVSEANEDVVSKEIQKTSVAASEALVNQTNSEDISRNEVSVAEKTVIHDDTSAANELSPKERKMQLMALVTAISLSSFF
ncbi:hemicentin-1-like [Penaeus indicus]|uniref:hemicentin-1-like n=1 Tax=Penaeus indicus TaxID=29960 RepID=UPI00300D4B9A